MSMSYDVIQIWIEKLTPEQIERIAQAGNRAAIYPMNTDTIVRGALLAVLEETKRIALAGRSSLTPEEVSWFRRFKEGMKG